MGCPYMEEYGVGDYWCRVDHMYVDDDTRNRFCYHSLDYHDCPAWKGKEHWEHDIKGREGAERAQGDNCFLTTACVQARGLPDDCDELQTMRGFRDNFLMYQTNGGNDVALYYKVAPTIVREINMRTDADTVWDGIYRQLVEPCVRLVKAGENQKAYELYKRITLDLVEKYAKAA